MSFGKYSSSLSTALKNAEKVTNQERRADICGCALVIGVLMAKTGNAYNAIEKLCPDTKALSNELLEYVKTRPENTSGGRPTFSPELGNALETATQSSFLSGNNGSITTDNIIIAFLSMTPDVSVTNQILTKNNIQLETFEQLIAEAEGGALELVGGHGEQAKPVEKKALKAFARNLTADAVNGKIAPVIGCEEEIRRVIQILSRKTKNNPIIIGEPGVGKTAISEGIALAAVADGAPKFLSRKRFYALSLTDMVAGTKYRGEFEQRMQVLLEELKADKDAVVFIDEIHTIVGAGSGEGAMDAANIMKPALSRGEVQVVGMTTLEDYRKKIEKDKALARRFQPVFKEEPTQGETIQILQGIRSGFELFHGVRYSDEVLEHIIKVAYRYLPERKFPDKAIDILDEVGSKLRMDNSGDERLYEAKAAYESIKSKLDKAMEDEDYILCEQLRDEYTAALAKYENLEANSMKFSEQDFIEVSFDDVNDAISKASGIPVTHIASADEKSRILSLEMELSRSVAAQDEAISGVSKAVRRSKVGLKERNKPAGTFLFLGPTGVGKTEMAKAMAHQLFGTEDAVVRIDCSEYSEKFNLSKLLGGAPGYVGYEQASALEPVRQRPYTVVLFDEVEKAHPDFLQTLLPILDEGKIKDSSGNVVHFENAYVILTGNIGAAAAQKEKLGFGTSHVDKRQHMKDEIMKAAKKALAPEFLNRLDNIVVFNPLSQDDCFDIMEIIIAKHNASFLKDINIQLECSPELVRKVVAEGYSNEYGARPLKRKFQDLVLDELTSFILKQDAEVTGTVKATLSDGGAVEFSVQAEEKAPVGA